MTADSKPHQNTHSLHRAGWRSYPAPVRAIVTGCAALVIASAFYSGVFALRGLEFVLAVAIGHLVGAAVKAGSRGRGGWGYQSVAIALTYFAIAMSYVPLVEKESQRAPVPESVRPAVVPPTYVAPALADTITISARGPEVGHAIDSATAARRERERFPVMQTSVPTMTTMGVHKATHLGFGRILLIAIVLPLAASISSVISLLIISVALIEAWRLNRRMAPKVAGHRLLAMTEAS